MTACAEAVRSEKGEEPGRPAAAVSALAGPAQTMLALQGAAGNAAARALARRVAPPPDRASRLLARTRDADEALEQAGTVALREAVVARTVRVANPGGNIPNPGGTGVVQSNAATVKDYLTQLCPTGGVSVNNGTGAVALSGGYCSAPALAPGTMGPPLPSPAQSSATPAGCDCLCDMIGSANSWAIEVDDAAWPHTDFTNHTAANGPGPPGSGGKVTAPSPNSTKLWGAGTTTGAAQDIPAWLVLGHELCGHAWMGDHGAHAPDEAHLRGEGGHQATVQRENLIRGEHSIALRGSYKDPNCGESYYRDRASPGTVHWSSSRAVCIAWRNAYNAAHGTSYTINDRIP
jgi:hypothetical protein